MAERIEYGVICDRTGLGLGKQLLATSPGSTDARLRALDSCLIKGEHVHELVSRILIVGDWAHIQSDEVTL